MYVLETMFPDGPHWYAGIRQATKNGQLVQGPEWSPYWEDRKEMSFKEADICLTVVCRGVDGVKMIPTAEAQFKDSWKHLGGDEVQMRAKYLQKGMKILRTGVFYIVNNITDKDIVTYPASCFRDGKAIGGASQKIGRMSNEWVTVIYKPIQQPTS